MNRVVAIVDGGPIHRPNIIPASLIPGYNISLNLSSVLAMLPGSRFFARLRRGAYQTALDATDSPTSSLDDIWTTETFTHASMPPAIPTPSLGPTAGIEQVASFPGPWGFFTSWYMIGLFCMAVLLHRIQNIVIPSRQPSRRQRHAFRFGPSYAPSRSLFQHIYGSILPLDFSRTTTRLVLHLPSAYLLCKMFFIWFLLILQTSEIIAPYKEGETAGWWIGLPFLQRMVQWSGQKEMRDVCWSTFCAVCLAFLIEGLVKGLDGMSTGFPIGNANPNTSPFNLVGYAFLLHVYSSPITHAYRPLDNYPSRPDKHVIITIAIPLLQLTIFHLLSISKRLSSHRLIPTALTSFLSLLHFHGTLFSHFRKSTFSPLTPTSTTAPEAVSPHVSPHVSYPLLNYIPNIFETFLISTILLTIFLNTLVQLLVRGRVDRVFSGLGIGSGTVLQEEDDASPPGFFRSLPLDEDFGVLLLRVGIASLEATGLRGWGNEVAPISLPVRTQRRRRRNPLSTPAPLTASGSQSTYGVVRMGRGSVGEVYSGSTPIAIGGSSSAVHPRRAVVDDVFSDLPSSRRRNRATRPVQQRRQGLENEVRTVDLGNGDGAGTSDGHGHPSDGGGWFGSSHWWRWLGVFGMFCGAVWGVFKGLVMLLLDRAMGRSRVAPDAMRKNRRKVDARRHKARGGGSADEEETEEEKRTRKEREVYERFLRGEDISDDDEDSQKEAAWLSSDDSDESNVDAEEEQEEREAEAVKLFTDILRNGSLTHEVSMSPGISRGGGVSASASGEMVLAHLMHGGTQTSPGPLTRRRWNALVRQEDGVYFDDEAHEEDDDEFGGMSRTIATASGENGEARMQQTCVICTSEGRDIICWPCRCLAMCDGCREALASKSAPTKHRCPCCRRPVEGYSRIYIP